MAEKIGPLPKKWPKHPPRRKHCNNYPPWNHRSPCKIGHPPQGSSSNHQLFGVNLLFQGGYTSKFPIHLSKGKTIWILGFFALIHPLLRTSFWKDEGWNGVGWCWLNHRRIFISYRSYLIFANFSNHNFFLKKTLGFCSLNFKKSKKSRS